MTKHRAFHLTAIFFSGFVCCYDNMLSVIYHESLEALESNPLGSYLIEVGGVSWFVVVKAVTTVLAVMLLYGISFTKWRMLVFVAAFCQAYLFYYLNYYDPDGVSNRSPVNPPVKAVIKHFVDGEPIPEFDDGRRFR